VGIYVSDQRRALQFFSDALGCTVVADEPMGDDENGPRWAEVCIPGDSVRLVLFTPHGQEDRVGSFSNVMFECDDMQATYEELTCGGSTSPSRPPARPGAGGGPPSSTPTGTPTV
jgi:catechol 2,3-dioxygenase-like lactoylglutathione lyase family enzyme